MTGRRIENLHVAFWLLKDCSWCSNWKWIGMAMVVPTLVMAGRIAWLDRKEPANLVHNIAVCFWALANITWMSGEFYFNDNTRWLAKIFFFTGLVLLVAYYACEAQFWLINRRLAPTSGCARRPPS